MSSGIALSGVNRVSPFIDPLVLTGKSTSLRSDELLNNACATDIARVWRGYCGRIDADYLRAEMARFLFAIRLEEARDKEEEFLALQRRFV